MYLHGTHPCPRHLEIGFHLQANHVMNKQTTFGWLFHTLILVTSQQNLGILGYMVHGTWQCNMEWTR